MPHWYLSAVGDVTGAAGSGYGRRVRRLTDGSVWRTRGEHVANTWRISRRAQVTTPLRISDARDYEVGNVAWYWRRTTRTWCRSKLCCPARACWPARVSPPASSVPPPAAGPPGAPHRCDVGAVATASLSHRCDQIWPDAPLPRSADRAGTALAERSLSRRCDWRGWG
jgi:hypothetical protein